MILGHAPTFLAFSNYANKPREEVIYTTTFYDVSEIFWPEFFKSQKSKKTLLNEFSLFLGQCMKKLWVNILMKLSPNFGYSSKIQLLRSQNEITWRI